MAVSDPYFDAEAYRTANGLLDESEDDIIDVQAEAISRYLEKVTGQWFNTDEMGEVRRFVGNGTSVLRVDQDGCPGIADADGVTVTGHTSFELFPLNAALGPEPKPFTSIVLTSGGVFAAGTIVDVEADWGWPAVPKLVIETGIELLAIWRGQSPRSTGNMAEIDGVVAMSPMAMSLVKRVISAYTKVRVA